MHNHKSNSQDHNAGSRHQKNQGPSARGSTQKKETSSSFRFVDNRSESTIQRTISQLANNRLETPIQKQQLEKDTPLKSLPEVLQKKENNTGLPDQLKSGIEQLSGYTMDDVKVHRNSDKPSKLQAHAYAQGTDIHLGPGQEKHLAHEAWHVVQQKQGRVKPTMQMKGLVPINDDAFLEKEADLMGAKALQLKIDNENTIGILDKRPSTLIQKKLQSSARHYAKNTENTELIGAPIQLMSLYHGTTIEQSADIVQKIDPSMGYGEFGSGFYTVFGANQAMHIAKYYWDSEKKYENKKNYTGVAVVEVDIPDNWWKNIMATDDADYTVKHFDSENGYQRSELKPNWTGNKALTDYFDDEAGELDERPDGLDWLPRDIDKDWDYAEDHEKGKDWGNDIMIGDIKDSKTPYLQVVFGEEMKDFLKQKEIIKRVHSTEPRPPGKVAVYGGASIGVNKNVAIDEAGSNKITDAHKLHWFKEGVDLDNSRARMKHCQDVLGGINDKHIPQAIDEYLLSNDVTGTTKDGRLYDYITNGIRSMHFFFDKLKTKAEEDYDALFKIHAFTIDGAIIFKEKSDGILLQAKKDLTDAAIPKRKGIYNGALKALEALEEEVQ